MDYKSHLISISTWKNMKTVSGCILLLISFHAVDAEPMIAQTILMTNSQFGVSKRLGTVLFTQNEQGGPVRITGELSFTGSKDSEVGMHVHAYGNLSQGCDSTGPHFNPNGQQHGARTDKTRHIGDLGNVQIVDQKCIIDITDDQIQLSGLHSIIGRSLVVHMNKDDFGKGDNEQSLQTGNVGRAHACGIIGVASDFLQSAGSTNPQQSPSSSGYVQYGAALVVILIYNCLRIFYL